jgi:hypothetical protein
MHSLLAAFPLYLAFERNPFPANDLRRDLYAVLVRASADWV